MATILYRKVPGAIFISSSIGLKWNNPGCETNATSSLCTPANIHFSLLAFCILCRENSWVLPQVNTLVKFWDRVQTAYCNCVQFSVVHVKSEHTVISVENIIGNSHSVWSSFTTTSSSILAIFFLNQRAWRHRSMWLPENLHSIGRCKFNSMLGCHKLSSADV